MKGLNLGKSIDKKFGADTTSDTTEEAKYASGLYSYSFKPANEPIIIVQKPYKAKSLTQHTIDWYNERKEYLDKGIPEEDLCYYTTKASGGARVNSNSLFKNALPSRIPVENEVLSVGGRGNHTMGENYGYKKQNPNKYPSFSNIEIHQEGRCPATMLVSDNCLDCGRVTKTQPRRTNATNKGYMQLSNKYPAFSNLADQGDLSKYFSLDNWSKKHLPELYKLSKKCLQLEEDVKKTGDFFFVPKPDARIKSIGLEDFALSNKYDKGGQGTEITDQEQILTKNTHMTAKPIDLFCYLINIFSHPNDIVLDPFCGSGTTCIASTLIDRKYIGLELEKEYFDIAEARVAGWQKQIAILQTIKHGGDMSIVKDNEVLIANKDKLQTDLEQETLF